ncbi:MAG: hypothetical protein ABJA76_15280 [Mucilaginibacter sp.]
MFEGALGSAFKKNGFEVTLLQCGQFFKSCETKSHFKDNQMTCSMCHEEFKHFKEAFGLESIKYEELISDTVKKEIETFVYSCDLTKVDSWKGYSIKDEWSSAVQRYYLSSNMHLSANPEIARNFLFTTISSFEAGRILKEDKKFTHLITSHGIYSTWGGVIAGFKAAGGNVTVWGRGYYNSGILSYKGGSFLNGLKHFMRGDFLDRLNPGNVESIKAYMESRWTLTNDNDLIKYYDNKDPIKNNELSLPAGKKYIGFYPNIPWDGQVFVATENYRGLRDVIESLMKFVAENPEAHIIVRPHPYENPAKNPNIGERFMDLAAEYNLSEANGFSIIPYSSSIKSYDLAEMVNVNVLLAGTIGLEFAAKGFPVIQLGENISSNKGIFFEPKNYDELSGILTKLLFEEREKAFFDADLIKRNALEWCAFFFKQAHLDDPFFKTKGTKMIGIKEQVDEQLMQKYMEWVLSGEGLFYTKS